MKVLKPLLIERFSILVRMDLTHSMKEKLTLSSSVISKPPVNNGFLLIRPVLLPT